MVEQTPEALVTPVRGGEAVVNGTPFESTSRSIYVGVTGNVNFKMADGTDLTFVGMHVGWHPIRATQVNTSGTTATNIVATW